MVSLVALLIPLLAFCLWWPCAALSRPRRWALIAVTAGLGVFPALLLKAVQTGAMDYTTIARLQVPGGWVLAVLLMLTPFLAARELLWLVARLARLPFIARLAHAPGLTAMALATAAALSGLGVYNALQPPRVQEQTVAIKNLPAPLRGLRIAVLADIHASPVADARHVQTIVERTLAARPDLIVLPGDLVDGDAASGSANIAPLARLKAPLGVWVAPGNHEYYSGYDAWMAEFRRLGLNLLENRMQLLDINGVRFALSGVGDPAYGRTSPYNSDPTRPEGVAPDVDAVARQARAAQAQFHLLLAHQPKFARDNADKGVSLQISGHTHGGQIRGMDQWLVAPANNGFVRSQYDVGDMKLLVSAGAGQWAGFAVRLGIAPSIDVLRLESL